MKREHIALLTLVLLNIIIRFPITPHELGVDSFVIHNMASSILEYGYAKWIVHPLSFFGLYAYSYASGIPYLLAICSLLTGLEMELTIYGVSLLLGITGMFTAFSLAGEFDKSFVFRLIVAFIFSLSPLALKFTIWTISTRGPFIMLLPLLIWCFLRMYKEYDPRYLTTSMIFFILLASTHKMFALIFLIIGAYIIAFWLSKITRGGNMKHSIYLFSFLFLFLFLIQFFLNDARWAIRYTPFLGRGWYDYLIATVFEISARLGFLMPLTLIGLVYLVSSGNGSKECWFLIIVVLIFTPLLNQVMYFYQTLLPFFSILSAFGIIYLLGILDRLINRRYSITLILIAITCFSLFTLIVRYTNKDQYGYSNYMLKSTYSLAEFIQKDTEDNMIFGSDIGRVSAFVTNPSPPIEEPEYFIYDFLDERNLKVIRKPIPRSFNEILSFVRYPYGVKRPSWGYEVEYMLGKKDERVNFPGYDRENVVYDNELEIVWDSQRSDSI
ncbi:MAG: hypothetical protein V1921_07820 [Candidatus Altiarchaeota archaeon]